MNSLFFVFEYDFETFPLFGQTSLIVFVFKLREFSVISNVILRAFF